MNHLNQVQFPRGEELHKLLDLDVASPLDDLFQRILENPIQDLFARPKKSIRSHLIDVGLSLCTERQSAPTTEHLSSPLYEILELLHAGSLIIDDIEDNSVSRRGKPTLHRTYGVPIALNAGNWLYFMPFQVINAMQIPAEQKAVLSQECQHTLLLAHYGQALDVGIEVDTISQERVPEVVFSSIELKSGVLASFALKAPALALGQQPHPKLARWGRRLGIALQMFDDIGNFTASKNIDKRFEDLKLKRLSFILSVLAMELKPQEYANFWNLAKDQDHTKMSELIIAHRIPEIAKQKAWLYIDAILDDMKQDGLSDAILEQFISLKNLLLVAYE